MRIFADPERALAVTDPDQRELYISLGCALENLLVAAERYGFQRDVTYFPEGETSTLGAILNRHNDNSVYRYVPLPDELHRRLEACFAETELRLDLIHDHLFRRWVDELTFEADHVEFANPAFRQELGQRIGEGAFGKPGLVSRLGRLLVSRLDLGESVANQDRKIVESAALLGVVSAATDSHLVHVRTGQLFERLWLTATALGVSIHPMSQTMRIPELRSAVAELLPAQGWIPQQLFRVGFSSRDEELRHTPRRPLGDVLLA